MKSHVLKSLALFCLAPLVSATVPVSPATVAPGKVAPDKIAGDYVEARTASVFAGACHYNGELVTTGRDAVLAWKFTAGAWKGTDLSGLRAMAAVTSDANLQDLTATRKSEILVDSSASAAQVSAFLDLLHARVAPEIGRVADVRRGTVAFSHTGSEYTVKSDGFAEMKVQSMPDDECCKQPSLVWYEPLTPLTGRKVGFTVKATSSSTIAEPWQREDENGAFYGALAF